MIAYEKELNLLNALGNQAIVCLTRLLSVSVTHKLRHILQDVKLRPSPWDKFEQVLAFLSTDILGDTSNTIRRIGVSMDQLEPVSNRDQLEPTWTRYDMMVRQKLDLGTITTDEDMKTVFHRLISRSDDFVMLRSDILVHHKDAPYDHWKTLALSHIRAHDLNTLTVNRYGLGHATPSINSTVSSPPSTSSNSPAKQKHNRCWNCRDQAHSSPQCTALYCRHCALKQRTCQWDSITSPGFHRHYQCVDCQPMFRIPPIPSAGPFPAPYARGATRAAHRPPRPPVQSYIPPESLKRTITQREGGYDSTDSRDDTEFEDDQHSIPRDV